MEINKHNQDANKLSQLLFDETFKKSNNPQKPYTTYTGDSTETFTPQATAEKMVEMLDDLDKKSREVNGQIDEQKPGSIWNDKTTFLDPSCKTGVFLKVIFDKLDTALQNEEVYGDSYKDVTTRRNHILDNQLFGLTLDNEQSLIASRRNVSGRWDYKNIQYIDKYIQKVVNKDERKKLKDMIKESLGVNMFDVVIGNPPYQQKVNRGGGRENLATDIFDLFIDYGIEISKHCCAMITPTKWINKTQLRYIKNKLSDGHLQHFAYYKNSRDAFGEAEIGGGVSYWCYDKTRKYGSQYIKNVGKGMAENSWAIRSLLIGDDIIIDNAAYRIIARTRNEIKFCPETGADPFGVGGKPWFNLRKSDSDCELRIFQKGNYRGLYTQVYFDIDSVKKIDSLYKYKVTIGKMNPDRGGVNNSNSWNVINRPRILPPQNVVDRNFMILFAQDNQFDCIYFMNYAKTKFFRFLALQGMSGTSLANKEVWRFVPMQRFDQSSDINWDKPVSEIDHQLYKKYNLTDDEIEYIEKTIKPMV